MSTISDIECKCPLCSKEFIETLQASYSTFGLYLDSMPYGAAIIPNPIVRCPTCGFTNGNFSKEEDGELLEEYLKNKKINQNEPRYYSLAKEYQFLNREDTLIAETYLNAFWESLDTYHNNYYDKDCNIKLQKVAIDKIDKINPTNQKYLRYQLIKLDLIRRLGEFDKGLSLIDEIRNKEIIRLSRSDDFSNKFENVFELSERDKNNKSNDSSNYQKKLHELLKIQEELIKNKDTDMHSLPKTLGKALFGSDGVGMIFVGTY